MFILKRESYISLKLAIEKIFIDEVLLLPLADLFVNLVLHIENKRNFL